MMPAPPPECGAVLRLKDWPDAVCHKPADHLPPHDGETGTALVSWIDQPARRLRVVSS